MGCSCRLHPSYRGLKGPRQGEDANGSNQVGVFRDVGSTGLASAGQGRVGEATVAENGTWHAGSPLLKPTVKSRRSAPKVRLPTKLLLGEVPV